MQLMRALRLTAAAAAGQTICFVGAGGKTTALFQLARQLVGSGSQTVYITTTTHLGPSETDRADKHIMAADRAQLEAQIGDDLRGVIVLTGEPAGEKLKAPSPDSIEWLRAKAQRLTIPLLIEADGSRRRPIKSPAAHEPALPQFADEVIVVAGLSALDQPIDDVHVHREKIFADIARQQIGERITGESITRALADPDSGLKNIPPSARRIALLNQADTPELESVGGRIGRALLANYELVVLGSLREERLQSIEHCAGIVLAAGSSTRFGSAKQLLDWHGKPFVRQVAETALLAGLWPVVVVTGFRAADVSAALKDMPINIVSNEQYELGQSTSIIAGVDSLPANVGSAIFLLADQPQIPAAILQALVDAHARDLPPILAPLVLGERRANPVLFDKVAFTKLRQLTGDVGGRALFDKFKVEYLPWHDDILMFDVDTPEDYSRLMEIE